MDPSEKFERLIAEALTTGRKDLDRIDRLIAGESGPATVLSKVARCFRCHASLSTQEIQGGWRDIASGLLDAKAARAALSRMVYVQHDLKHGPGGTGRNGPCDTDCVKCAAEEEIRRVSVSIQVDKSPPAPVFGTLATLPLEVVYPETAPHLKTLRDRSAPDKERLGARRWLQLNGYESIVAVRAECDRVFDEIQLARLERAGALPVGKAPHPDRAHDDSCRCKVCCATKFGRGAQCRRCNTDNPHRVINAVTELCKDCERVAFDGFVAGQFPRSSRPIVVDCDPPTPPPRPDGFLQSQVDAAKAVLLAPVAKRGGR